MFTISRAMAFLSLPTLSRTVESLHSEVSVTSNLAPCIRKLLRLEITQMNYDMKQSGERIRQLRINNRLTQEKTANALNIDQSYYGRIETGKRGCPVDLFIQLSDLFGVSLDYLILGRSGISLPEDTAVTQLKSDIDNLVEQLERFKTSL